MSLRDKCIICLEPLTTDGTVNTIDANNRPVNVHAPPLVLNQPPPAGYYDEHPDKHFFHASCIARQTENSLCPICRQHMIIRGASPQQMIVGEEEAPLFGLSFVGEDSDEERQVDELPAHRRRRRRNQHLIPGKCLFVARVGRGRRTNSRYGKRFSSERRACRTCRLYFLVPAGLPLSLPLP